MNFAAVRDTGHHVGQRPSGVTMAQVTVRPRPPLRRAHTAQRVDMPRAPYMTPARLQEVQPDRPLGVDDGQGFHEVLPVQGHSSATPLVEPGNDVERLGVEGRLVPRGGSGRLGLWCLQFVNGAGGEEHVLAIYGLDQLLLLLLT